MSDTSANGTPTKLRKRSEAIAAAADDADGATLDSVTWGGADILDTTDVAPRWLVEDVCEPGQVMLIVGQEKLALKTWLCLDLMIKTVVGGSWLGHRVVPQPGKVALMLTRETPRVVLKRRVWSLCAGLGVDVRSVAPFLRFCDASIALVPRAVREQAYEDALTRGKLDALRTSDEGRRRDMLRGAERSAELAVSRIGSGHEVLDVIHALGPGMVSVVCGDTARPLNAGDENDSRDAERLVDAKRELVRDLDAVGVFTHHNAKGGHGMRAARGSSAFTAAVDGILNVDAGEEGEPNLVDFTLRAHPSPPAVSYTLRVERPEGEAEPGQVVPVRVEVIDAAADAGDAAGGSDGEVLAVLRARDEGFTVAKIGRLVSAARGNKPGSKVKAKTLLRALERLAAKGLASRCTITSKHKRFEGWTFGPDGGEFAGKRIDDEAAVDEPFGTGGDPWNV